MIMITIITMLRLFVFVELLSPSFNRQVAGSNKTHQNNSQTDDNCVVHCEGGKVINLNPLKQRNGFTTLADENNYMYGYYPCKPFIKEESPLKGECDGDDAVICMWTTEGAKVYQNIGRHSSVRCFFHEIRGTHLEYNNTDYAPDWKAIVFFKCDQENTKTVQFSIINSTYNPRKFRLTHSCFCDDQCAVGYALEKIEEADHPTPEDSSEKYWQGWLEYGAIGAFGLTAVIILLYQRKRIWHCIKGQNNNNDETTPLFNEGQDGIVGYTANLPKDINVRKSKRDNTTAVFQ